MFSSKISNIFQEKKSVLATVALIIIPVYSWKSLWYYWNKLNYDYEQKLLFHKRHNSVVTYQANKGFSGWPPNVERIRPNPSCDKIFQVLYEPMLYFIQTATTSLDIAFMLINVKDIYMELIKATQRGINIRLLCNFHHIESSQEYIKTLIAKGAKCQFFIAPTTTMDTIMHHKYIIKDYSLNSGFICMGSMNATATSVLNNYESVVFLSDQNVVNSFKQNFEECWQNIKIDNEGLINKIILANAQIDCSNV